MPFASNDDLPEGAKSLPPDQQTKWRKVFNAAYEGSCADSDDRDACASKIAWSQVKKADLEEFSLTIKKAVFDEPTQEMRWRADTSDIDDDSYGDNMTLELFEDFVDRINKNELAPEEFRSNFWQGGMPYLSVSHYSDQNGEGVPGMPDKVYMDGKFLKAMGKYYDTPIGRACFKAACRSVHSKDEDEKVRISIGFLDWMHKHKSNGYVFERKDVYDLCPECIAELINGEYKGRTFIKGQLVHFAHTGVPINKRTIIAAEVDKAMTAKTRKEDAEFVLGDKDLADELDKREKAKLVGKSEVEAVPELITKSESDDEPEETIGADDMVVQEAEHGKDMSPNKHAEDEEYPDCKDEKTGEMDEDCVKMHQKKAEVRAEVTKMEGATVDASYRPYSGATSIAEAKKILEAKQEIYRLEDLWYMLQGVMENIFYNDSIEDKGKAIKTAVDEFKGYVEQKSLLIVNNAMLDIKALLTPKEASPTPFDQAIVELKSDFDQIASTQVSAEEKLQMFQQSYASFGQKLADTLRATAVAKSEAQPADNNNNTADLIAQALAPLNQKIELLMQMAQQRPALPVAVPERRSINPALVQQSVVSGNANLSPLRKMMNRSVGLPENTP